MNLSELIWIKLLNTSMPKNLIIREIFGIILTGIYLVAIPPLIAKSKWGKKLIDNIGQIRYLVVIFLILGMTSLPIKMLLRWTISLKYLVALPEWELNL